MTAATTAIPVPTTHLTRRTVAEAGLAAAAAKVADLVVLDLESVLLGAPAARPSRDVAWGADGASAPSGTGAGETRWSTAP